MNDGEDSDDLQVGICEYSWRLGMPLHWGILYGFVNNKKYRAFIALETKIFFLFERMSGVLRNVSTRMKWKCIPLFSEMHDLTLQWVGLICSPLHHSLCFLHFHIWKKMKIVFAPSARRLV